MRLSGGGCPGNRGSVVHFLWRFLGQGWCAWKWAAVEKMGFYRTHYARIYSPERIAVDCCAYSHSEFNLGTLNAYLRKPSFAVMAENWSAAGKTYTVYVANAMEDIDSLEFQSFQPLFLWILHLKRTSWILFLVQQANLQHPCERFKALLLSSSNLWRRVTENGLRELFFSNKKTSSVIRVNKCQHITDRVGTVHTAADCAVRPLFYNVVNIVFLSSVFLIRRCDQMQN